MHFELVHTHKQWFWRLKASNGKTLCHSENYNQKQSAIKAIKAVCRACSKPIKVIERIKEDA